MYFSTDKLIGGLLILFFLLSLSLNLFVVGYQAVKSRSNVGRLYMVLAISDGLTAVSISLLMIYHFFSQPHDSAKFPYLILSSFISTTTLQVSGFIMTVISVYRFFIVRNPLTLAFRRKRDMRAVCSALAIISIIGTFLQLQSTKWHWYHNRQIFDVPNCLPCHETRSYHEYNLTIIIRFGYIFNAIFSICVSGMTIGTLYRSDESRTSMCARFRKSCVTIFIMNVINFGVVMTTSAAFIGQIVFQKDHLGGSCEECLRAVTPRFEVLLFLGYPLSPLLLTLANPSVIVTRGTDMRFHLVKVIRSWCGLPPSHPATPTSLYSSSMNLALHRVISVNRNSALAESHDMLSGLAASCSLSNSGVSFAATASVSLSACTTSGTTSGSSLMGNRLSSKLSKLSI